MRTERVYQLDDNDNVIGEFVPIEEHPFYKLKQKLKQRKIEEIHIEMEEYGITLNDLKEGLND